MKPLLVLISLLVFNILQAQEKNSVFKYVITDEKKAIVGIKSKMNSSAFISNSLTAAENYDLVYDFISKKYEYPEDIILNTITSEKIVIQELAQGLYETKSMGFTKNFDIRYIMSFLTTDGSIECIIDKMLVGNTAAMTQNMETEWNEIDGLYLHRKNGKPKKSMKGITDVSIENYFNSILTKLKS